MGKTGFALQSDVDGYFPRLIPLNLALVDRPPDPQQRAFVHVEVDVHRIQRDDGRQQRLVLNHQVAQCEEVTAGLAVDRRGHLGEAEIEAVDLHARLEGFDRGIGLVDGRLVLVELLPADRPGRLGHLQVASVVRLGQCKLRLVEIHLSFGLVELSLVWPAVYHKQQIPLLDFRPLLERHLAPDP